MHRGHPLLCGTLLGLTWTLLSLLFQGVDWLAAWSLEREGAALLGIFDTTKETLGVVGEWKLDGDVEKGEEFDATATLEQTLRIRDEQQQRRAEAHNRLEA